MIGEQWWWWWYNFNNSLTEKYRVQRCILREILQDEHGAAEHISRYEVDNVETRTTLAVHHESGLISDVYINV